jgi:hypothetical protein
MRDAVNLPIRDPKTNRRSLLGTVEFAQKIDGLDRRVLDAPASRA